MPLVLAPSGQAANLAQAVSFADEVLRLVNQRRHVAGKIPLRMQKNLIAAAQGHARDMAARNYIAHRNPEGQSVGARIDAEGYKGWVYAGENIGAGHTTPEQIVTAWWNSTGHRRNMLDGDFIEAGVGYCYQADDAAGVVLWNGVSGGPYYHYWVLDLARRKAPAFLPLVLSRVNALIGRVKRAHS